MTGRNVQSTSALSETKTETPTSMSGEKILSLTSSRRSTNQTVGDTIDGEFSDPPSTALSPPTSAHQELLYTMEKVTDLRLPANQSTGQAQSDLGRIPRDFLRYRKTKEKYWNTSPSTQPPIDQPGLKSAMSSSPTPAPTPPGLESIREPWPDLETRRAYQTEIVRCSPSPSPPSVGPSPTELEEIRSLLEMPPPTTTDVEQSGVAQKPVKARPDSQTIPRFTEAGE